MTHALITGAAGFIGSHLAESLLAVGTSVRGLDRFSDYYDPALKRANLTGLESAPGFELVEGDLGTVGLEELLDGIDVVYHLAGQPGVRASWGTEFEIYVRDNVLGTQRLLEAARGASLERFVYASSSSVYGDAERYPRLESDAPAPISPYGVTKLAAEHLCVLYAKGFDVPATAVRYFTIFGPRQRPDMAFTRFIEAALEGAPIEVFGDGEQSRDFTYVGDAVAATIAAASRGRIGEVYNIAGGTDTTVHEVIEIIERLVGSSIAIEHRPAVVGDVRKTGGDTTKARLDLGYSPQTSLEQGLANQVEAARARGG